MSLTPFRLIKNDPSEGAWNMAVDEAIFQSVGEGHSLPTIRLYGWKPACLSLGYSQSISDVNREKLKSEGWGLVRRLTGGKAILHVDELTYSISAPINHPLVTGTLLESYNRIAKGLLRAMTLLGIGASLKHRDIASTANSSSPVCFEVPSTYEITSNGKKLIGSAQARRQKGVLQHGSLPLTGDLGRIINVLKFKDDFEQQKILTRLMDHATTVKEAAGKYIPLDAVIKAFEQGFSTEFGIEFVESNLTEGENTKIEELFKIKYQSNEWIARV